MNDTTTHIAGGLKPLPPDPRDFPLGGIFGIHDIDEVPLTDWVVAEPKYWKDQGTKDFCTGYAVTEASEDQEEMELDPDFQFAASCMLRGTYGEWGCDLRTAAKSAVEVGSLPVGCRHRDTSNCSRDELADWTQWPEEDFKAAEPRKKASYFKVDGPYDLFDNVRAALWRHRDEKRTIVVGTLWHDSWTASKDGIIREPNPGQGFGHALKVYGQKMIDGAPYLVAQLSNGPIGDRGRFYFSRKAFNEDFEIFGQFMFKDLPKQKADRYLRYGIHEYSSVWTKIWRSIIGFLSKK